MSVGLAMDVCDSDDDEESPVVTREKVLGGADS